jgi:predicted amidohydrolase YtcJ
MRKRVLAFCFTLFLLSCTQEKRPGADVLIHNARVYTVDDARPWAEAVALQADKIIWVGDEVDAAAYRDADTEVIDAQGRLLLPGFIDSHNHIRYGNEPNSVDLSSAESLAAVQETIQAFASAHPELPWISGGGWLYTAFPGDGLPRAEYLNGLTQGRPAFFLSYDAHTAWLNTKAMEAIELEAGSELSAEAEVVVDPESGAPTGVIQAVVSLGEANLAMKRLRQNFPEGDRLQRSLEASLLQALGYGITTIIAPQTGLDELDTFVAARDAGTLKARVQTALFHPVGTPASDLPAFSAAAEALNDDRLRVSAIKLYVDDVIEAHTAALLEPYSDQPEESGETFYPPEAFRALVARLDAAGHQLFIHAIGDRGNRIALDALEHAQKVNGQRDSRHQLVHVELVAPEDQPRFAELGVTACMQPRHVLPESNGQWIAAVGPDRLRYAFPWKSLHEQGARLAFSSDWDVSEMNPLVGIYSAVTRQGLGGEAPGGWVPEERVDLETAIRAYTINGAYANFVEGNRGSIRAGQYADLILLSKNLFEIPPSEFLETRVDLTWVGGELVYRRVPPAAMDFETERP